MNKINIQTKTNITHLRTRSTKCWSTSQQLSVWTGSLSTSNSSPNSGLTSTAQGVTIVMLMKSFFLLKTRPRDLINQVLNPGISSEAHWQRASHCSSTPTASWSTSTPSSLMRGPASTISKFMKMIIRTSWSYLLNWFQHLTFLCPGTFSSSSSSFSPRSQIKSSQSRSRNITLIMFRVKMAIMMIEMMVDMSVTATKIKIRKDTSRWSRWSTGFAKTWPKLLQTTTYPDRARFERENLLLFLFLFALDLFFLTVPPDFQN